MTDNAMGRVTLEIGNQSHALGRVAESMRAFGDAIKASLRASVVAVLPAGMTLATFHWRTVSGVSDIRPKDCQGCEVVAHAVAGGRTFTGWGVDAITATEALIRDIRVRSA